MTSVLAREIIVGAFFTMIRFFVILYIVNFYVIKRELSKRGWDENIHYIKMLNLIIYSIYIIGDILFTFVLFRGNFLFFGFLFSIFILPIVFYFFIYVIIFVAIIISLIIITGYYLTKRYYEITSNEIIGYIIMILLWQICIIVITFLILVLIHSFEVIIMINAKYSISSIYPEIYSPLQEYSYIYMIFTLNTIIILYLFYILVKGFFNKTSNIVKK